jgi:uncharacterized protein YggT (Ycf19 family)
MAVLDFILNCACLLLWLNWRSRGLTNLPRASGIALIGTLRKAERRKTERWPSSLVLLFVLLARAILYRQAGGSAQWVPTISLGPITLHFRSDLFMPMLLFSVLGFLVFLAAFYFSLLLLAAVNRSVPNNNSWLGLIRAHLGIVSRLPAPLMLLAPFVLTFLFWLALGSLFGALHFVAPARSFEHLLRQAAIISASGGWVWPYVLAVIFLLHVVSSYVYLGSAQFWNFINVTARQLLRPIALLPLRVGKLDFAPLLGLALMLLLIFYAPRGLAWLHQRFAF